MEGSGFDPLLTFLLKILHMNPIEWKKWMTKTLKQKRRKKRRSRKYRQDSDSESEIDLDIEISDQKALNLSTQSVLLARLRQYTTSTEEDLNLYHTIQPSLTSNLLKKAKKNNKRKAQNPPDTTPPNPGTLSLNQKNALIARLSEKTILQDWLSSFDQ